MYLYIFDDKFNDKKLNLFINLINEHDTCLYPFYRVKNYF